MNKKKIAIICNTDGALFNFRKPIIDLHVKDDYIVHTFSNDSNNYFPDLIKLKCIPNVVRFDQKNSFFKNLGVMTTAIFKIIKFNPDIIHIYTLQPIVLLSIPLRLMGFKFIFSTVTGMGRNFDIHEKPLSIKQKFILFILKLSFLANKRVHVQNDFDKDFLIKNRVISQKKIIKVNGSGIDISNRENDLKNVELNLDFKKVFEKYSNKKIILYVARGMKEKGLFHFAEAAKIVSKINSDFQFIHVGGYPEFMTKDEYEHFAKEHSFVVLGYVKQMGQLFRLSDIVVLPSIYREGTPKSLIEAIYYNKIIVTNDVPGCNETVIDGANGWLAKAGNTNDLVSKILKINELDNNLVRKTNDFLITKYDIKYIYELNKLMYENINFDGLLKK